MNKLIIAGSHATPQEQFGWSMEHTIQFGATTFRLRLWTVHGRPGLLYWEIEDLETWEGASSVLDHDNPQPDDLRLVEQIARSALARRLEQPDNQTLREDSLKPQD